MKKDSFGEGCKHIRNDFFSFYGDGVRDGNGDGDAHGIGFGNGCRGIFEKDNYNSLGNTFGEGYGGGINEHELFLKSI